MTRLHPIARTLARDASRGMISRREFMSRATSLGLSATAAYGLLGLAPTPGRTRRT